MTASPCARLGSIVNAHGGFCRWRDPAALPGLPIGIARLPKTLLRSFGDSHETDTVDDAWSWNRLADSHRGTRHAQTARRSGQKTPCRRRGPLPGEERGDFLK